MITYVRLQTPAKVNPVLEVLSKRPDGYHELSLIFQAVALFDELEILRGGDGLRFEIVESPGPPGYAIPLRQGSGGQAASPDRLPADDSNLIVKAAKLFLKEVLQGTADVLIRLKKRIPLAAGLGGGSSDAAATLFGLDLAFNAMTAKEQLQALAAQLGSDVPFFLSGGTALGRGRGEKITPWEAAPEMPLVLVKPAQGLSTPAVYQSGKAEFSPGQRTGLYQELLGEKSLPKIAGSLFNSLQPAAFYLMPEVERLRDGLLKAGALGALVSGSGPTVFGIAESPQAAQAIAAQMRGEGRTALATRTIGSGIQVLEKK